MGEVPYKGHRYLAEIIAHCVWLYHRLPLSFRGHTATLNAASTSNDGGRFSPSWCAISSPSSSMVNS